MKESPRKGWRYANTCGDPRWYFGDDDGLVGYDLECRPRGADWEWFVFRDIESTDPKATGFERGLVSAMKAAENKCLKIARKKLARIERGLASIS